MHLIDCEEKTEKIFFKMMTKDHSAVAFFFYYLVSRWRSQASLVCFSETACRPTYVMEIFHRLSSNLVSFVKKLRERREIGLLMWRKRQRLMFPQSDHLLRRTVKTNNRCLESFQVRAKLPGLIDHPLLFRIGISCLPNSARTSICIYDDSQIKKRSNIRTPGGRKSDHQSSVDVHTLGVDAVVDTQRKERKRERETKTEPNEVSEMTGPKWWSFFSSERLIRWMDEESKKDGTEFEFSSLNW